MKSWKIAFMAVVAASFAGGAFAQSNSMAGMSGMSQNSMGNMKMPAKKTTTTVSRTTSSHKSTKGHSHAKHHHHASK